MNLPKSPSAADVRAAELAMLPGLVAELRQPPVRHWPRCAGLIGLILATEDLREKAA